MAQKKKSKLHKRAGKLGMSPEMIETYPDEVALKQACDGMSQKTNPQGYPQAGKIPEPKKFDGNMPDMFEVESTLETARISINRNQYDEGILQAKLRVINRQYGVQAPVRIVKTMDMRVSNGKDEFKRDAKVFKTKFEIFMK